MGAINADVITHSIGKIEKIVEAKEFLKIISKDRDKIIDSKIILPELGSNNLGKFKITLK